MQNDTDNSKTDTQELPPMHGKFIAPIPRRIRVGEYLGNLLMFFLVSVGFLFAVGNFLLGKVPDMILGGILCFFCWACWHCFKFFWGTASFVKNLGDSVRMFAPEIPEE